MTESSPTTIEAGLRRWTWGYTALLLALIGAGAAALKLPACSTPDEGITWSDAAFTSVSAVCLTGLTVRDTAHDFTVIGQAVIAVLVQFGGLAAVALGAMLWTIIFRRHDERTAGRWIGWLVTAMLGIEVIGASAMWAAGWSGSDAAFHSIMAVNQTAFSTFEHGIGGQMHRIGAVSVVAVLAAGGSAGFIVWRHRVWRRRLAWAWALTMMLGGAMVAFSQWIPTQYAAMGRGQTANAPVEPSDDASWVLRIGEAAFTAAATRTAGLHVIDASQAPQGTLVTAMALIAVGGGPGAATGGAGLLAVVVAAMACKSAGRTDGEGWLNAHVSRSIVKWAIGNIVLMVSLTAATFTLLTSFESMPAGPLLFESVSAACNAGWSAGVSDAATVPGRWVLMAAMFVGHMAPMGWLAYVAGRGRRSTTESLIAEHHAGGQPIRMRESVIGVRRPLIAMLLLVALGALLLRGPSATPQGDATDWVDAAFMGAAAVCHTGLTVRDLDARLSTAGQVMVLAMMIGGVWCCWWAWSRVFAAMDANGPWQSIRRVISVGPVAIGVFTAAVLMAAMTDVPFGERPLIAAFTAVSAIGGAGLTIAPPETFESTSLMSHLMLAPAALAGTMGLMVAWPITQCRFGRARGRGAQPPSATERLARRSILFVLTAYVATTATLMACMMEGLTRGAASKDSTNGTARAVATAGYLAATRTTGFTSQTMRDAPPAVTAAMMPLMALGAAPGSAAAGMAAIALLGVARRRAAPALAALAGGLTLTFAATLMLAWCEPFPLERLLFEAVSAVSGAGASLDITSQLSTVGRCTILVAMVTGRLGVIWIAWRTVAPKDDSTGVD